MILSTSAQLSDATPISVDHELRPGASASSSGLPRERLGSHRPPEQQDCLTELYLWPQRRPCSL
jgi:hypothetical protein